MFTGLVQAVGNVEQRADLTLRIQAPKAWGEEGWVIGESVAVNGCCLTVVAAENGVLRFDLSQETLDRTALSELTAGAEVNLERAMRMSDRLGGHMVQGHVDTTGEIVAIEEVAGGWTVRFQVPADGARYLIDKGSVTIDGISLTVVEPDASGGFHVALIPHTWSHTALHAARAGQRVNIEYDVLVKHVERLMAFMR